ncbi:putative formylmethionine deformylase-like protein, partial [Podospora aff. communis PSN243]
MLRYGMALAFASKAGLSAAVVLAFRQRVWTTVRTKMMRVVALDSLFAATEDLWALLNWEVIRTAKVAVALAVFVWVAPLMVILTGNTLLVEPSTAVISSECAGVRTLNFAKEEEFEWRNPPRVEGLWEIPLSLWNTTKPKDEEPEGWFDYYTAPYPTLERTSTIGAFLDQAVTRKGAQVETCGSGWNCTFEIKFVAPAYKCTELASGIGSKAKNLTQESGSMAPPFDTDIILPKGAFSYYAFNTGGDYSTVQMKDVGIGGVPNTKPPYPKNFGAFRTEPVVWIGYAEIADPSKPIPTDPSSPEWATAFIPKLFACENYESSYTINVRYAEGIQFINTTNLTFHHPVINTTFLPRVDANDGTGDNVTAIPESNYIMPTDKARYRRTAAYHSLGLMLRTFLNGTISIDKDLVNPIVNTKAIQTRLLDPRNNYFPRPNLQSLVQPFYEDIILSMLSQPQFAPVVWAAKPDEQSGQLVRDEEGYRFPCSKSRTRNMYKYHARDLWIVYSIAITLALVGVVTGSWTMGGNQGGLRDTKWSDIVAATRGPALDGVNWEGRPGEAPARDVRELRVGYGVVGGEVTGGGAEGDGRATGWEGTRYGFGLEGEVRQVKREGSIWKL